MLIRILPLVSICTALCHANEYNNRNIRHKRSHEDEIQSNFKNAVRNVDNILNKLSNDKPESLNLRLGDVTSPLTKKVAKLSDVNTLPTTLRMPIQQILMEDDQKQPNSKVKLVTRESPSQLGKLATDTLNANNYPKQSKTKQARKKFSKHINQGKENHAQVNKNEQNIQEEDHKRPQSFARENKLNDQQVNKIDLKEKTNNFKQRIDNEDPLDDNITRLLKILENSLNSKDLKKSTDDETLDEVLENNLQVRDSYKNIPNEYNIDRDINEDLKKLNLISINRVMQILLEQNGLLKEILMKNLNFSSVSPRDKDENIIKTIHLILDINNTGVKEIDIPVNLVKANSESKNLFTKNDYFIKNYGNINENGCTVSSKSDNLNYKLDQYSLRQASNPFSYLINNAIIPPVAFAVLNKQESSKILKDDRFYTRCDPRQIAYDVNLMKSDRNARLNPESSKQMSIYTPIYNSERKYDSEFNSKVEYNENIRAPIKTSVNFDYKLKDSEVAMYPCPYHVMRYT